MLKSNYIILTLLMFIYNIESLKDYQILTIKDNYLSIPKINLETKFYEIDSIDNDINKNIKLIKNDKNNFIIAGHNGNTDISYFKDLEFLEMDDLIYLNYQNSLYIYKLEKIYQIYKTGYFKIETYDIPVINLITCKSNSNIFQMVYVGFLINKKDKL